MLTTIPPTLDVLFEPKFESIFSRVCVTFCFHEGPLKGPFMMRPKCSTCAGPSPTFDHLVLFGVLDERLHHLLFRHLDVRLQHRRQLRRRRARSRVLLQH